MIYGLYNDSLFVGLTLGIGIQVLSISKEATNKLSKISHSLVMATNTSSGKININFTCGF